MIRKMNLSKNDYFRERPKYLLRRPPNGQAGLNFVDYGDGATSPHLQDKFSRYYAIMFIGSGKKRNKPMRKRRTQCVGTGLVFSEHRISYWPIRSPSL